MNKLSDRHVSRETMERLDHFVSLFQKWAKSINLIASSTKADLWNRHVRDSAQIYDLAPGPHRWIDFGSGGGFPGMITAIRMIDDGDGWVHLVESNNKKAAFLRVALQETGARGTVYPIRVEAAPAEIVDCDFISARALADVDRLLGYAHPWMSKNPKIRAFFHKGRDYQSELNNARSRWSFDLIEHSSVVEPDSVVLDITNLQRR